MTGEGVAPAEITGRTRIMFILADPVAHVRASALLNRHFAGCGVDLAVSPLHVASEDLPAVVAAIRRMRNLAGFGVTTPYKIAVCALLDELTPRAERIGAVNFVCRNSDGSLVGDNLDGVGFIDGLTRSGIPASGQRILQVGAGGAGRSIAFALAEAGAAEIVIANRTTARAEALAAAVSTAYPTCSCRVGSADPHGFDLLVNTTSVGMKPGDAPPVDVSRLTADTAVAEIIMALEETPLLRAARALGCRTVAGRRMIEGQVSLLTAFLGLQDRPEASS